MIPDTIGLLLDSTSEFSCKHSRPKIASATRAQGFKGQGSGYDRAPSEGIPMSRLWLLCIAVCLVQLCAGPLSGSVVSFSGSDIANSTDPRPNSNATAGNF